jgi:hypothetical protein
VDERAAGSQCRIWVHDGWQRVVVHDHGGGSVLGLVRCLRDDHRHRLADEADHVAGERQMGRDWPATGQGGRDAAQVGKGVGGEHGHHAGQG